MKNAKLLFLLCSTLWGMCPEVLAQDAVSVAKRAYQSTVLLVMEDSSGQVLSVGSGFVVGEGLIATNMHVIDGAASGYAKFIGTKKNTT